jgi:hypothetical protein
MSNYIKGTNFTVKDTLPSGNASKIIRGAEIDDELTAIAAAVSSKADVNSPSLTGTPVSPTATAGTNTTQIATTAFVTGAVSDSVTAERTATATLTNKTLTTPTITAPVIATITNTGTITLPTSTDTLVGRSTTDTFTNKTVALGSNTVSGTKAQFNTAVTDDNFSFESDFTKSLTANGYQKLPGGLTIQWGTSGSVSANTPITITLPIAFTSVFASVVVNAKSNASGSQEANITSYQNDLSTFTINNRTQTTQTFSWIAIGY